MSITQTPNLITRTINLSPTLRVVIEDDTQKGIITTYYQYMWQGKWKGDESTSRMDRTFYDVTRQERQKAKDRTLPQPEYITIVLQETDQEEGGYMYGVYLGSPDEVDDLPSIDGGQCTSPDPLEAFDMAGDAVFSAIRHYQEQQLKNEDNNN